jgi:predicted amidohydrolase YtcJ
LCPVPTFPTSPALLLRRLSIPGGGGAVDVRLSGEAIVEVGVGLHRSRGEEELDGGGGQLLPGLHDHHVHLRAAAAARDSIDVSPSRLAGAVDLNAVLQAEDRHQPPGQWIRAVGYHESIAGGIDRHYVDSVVSDRPVRIQHRSGILWVLNSAGLRALDSDRDPPPGLELHDGRPTGRIWREDEWLRSRMPPRRLHLAAVSDSAASSGITGFTDATPQPSEADLRDLAGARIDGSIVQRLHLMSGPEVEPGHLDGATLGPVKYLLDDDRLPSLPDLVAGFRRAHHSGRPVAVHCVTRAQVALAVAAWEEAGAGPGDRIEHGSLISPDLFPTLRRLRLTVITQPGFVFSRGDQYLEDVESGDRDDLWRVGSLLQAGVSVAGGTDAPFGPNDPWLTVRAAMERRTGSGRLLGPGERVSMDDAVGLFLGSAWVPAEPRTIAPGQPADLCLLTEPLHPGRVPPPVAATFVGGRIVYRAA